jgi:hypothetical protein
MVSDTPAVGLNRLYDSGLHIINPGCMVADTPAVGLAFCKLHVWLWLQ